MAAQTRRELELRLKVVADTTGAKAGMDQLAQAAERAQRASSKAQQTYLGTPGLSIPGVGSIGARSFPNTPAGRAAAEAQAKRVAALDAAGQAAADIGRGGGMGGVGSAIAARFGIPTGLAGPAAAAAGAYQAVRTGKAAADAYQDEYLTEGQRARRIVGSVAGGSTFLSFADTITGRGRDMARAAEEGQRDAAVSSARTQFVGAQLGLQAGVSSAQARADSFAGTRPATVPYIDRSTATGERQFRIESQLAQVRERGAVADREAATAKDEALAADRRAVDLAREGERIDRRRADVQRDVDGQSTGDRTRQRQSLAGAMYVGITSGNPLLAAGRYFGSEALDAGGPNRVRSLNELERLGTERQSNAQMQAEQLRAAQAARTRQIAAEGQSRAAQVGVLGVQAADLEDRATRASSNAQRVALSSRDRVQEAIYAAERFKRGGLRALDPSELALVQEFGGEDVRAAAEREGKNDPRTRRLAELLPQTFQDGAADPEAFRRQANETRNQQAELQLQIDRDTATATANVVKTVAETIERVLIRALDQVEANMRTRQLGTRGSP